MSPGWPDYAGSETKGRPLTLAKDWPGKNPIFFWVRQFQLDSSHPLQNTAYVL